MSVDTELESQTVSCLVIFDTPEPFLLHDLETRVSDLRVLMTHLIELSQPPPVWDVGVRSIPYLLEAFPERCRRIADSYSIRRIRYSNPFDILFASPTFGLMAVL